MKTRVVPTGLAHLFHFTRHFRAGLSYPAASRLESWWCLLHLLRSMVVLTQSLQPLSGLITGRIKLWRMESEPQGLKPDLFRGTCAARLKAAPFQISYHTGSQYQAKVLN